MYAHTDDRTREIDVASVQYDDRIAEHKMHLQLPKMQCT